MEEKTKRKDVWNETKKLIYEFQQFETIRSFRDSIYNNESNRDDAEIDQRNRLENMVEFNNESGPKKIIKKDKKNKYFWNCECSLWRSRINS